MRLSKTDIELIEQNNSQFVSFKYVSDDGNMRQIDVAYNNIQEKEILLCKNELNLVPIIGKNFVDPFRSFPTTSFFCQNIASKDNARKLAEKTFNSSNIKLPFQFSAEIHFWIAGEDTINDYQYIADPIDKYSNLRSDIVSTLEKININTSMHFHGTTIGESVIGIRGSSPIDLADNILITKFIIANVVDSYGMKINFSSKENNLSNITFILHGQNSDLSLISKKLETHSTELLNSTIHNFRLGLINAYDTTLKINLICSDLFIPYLAFANLVLYGMKHKIVNEDIFKYNK